MKNPPSDRWGWTRWRAVRSPLDLPGEPVEESQRGELEALLAGRILEEARRDRGMHDLELGEELLRPGRDALGECRRRDDRVGEGRAARAADAPQGLVVEREFLADL